LRRKIVVVLERRASERSEREQPEFREPVAVPETMPARQQILALQRTLGNRAVGELLARTPGRERRIARLLLDDEAWKRRTTDFKREDDPMLGELDKLITEYARAATLADKRQALHELDRKAGEWLQSHWLRSTVERTADEWLPLWIKTPGLSSILTELRTEIAAALALAVATEGYDVGPWAIKLIAELAARGLADTDLMDALFYALLWNLPSGFTYYSGSDPGFLSSGAQASCMDLARALKMLGEALGLKVETAVISDHDFASPAGTSFVSPHGGNVRFEKDTDYTAKRFVFSSHMAAMYKGKYYDPTVRKTYGAPSDVIAWKLKEAGHDCREIESVADGATFPDGTPVNADTAVLERDTTTTSHAFENYWVVKRKPKAQ
jgi:hypothetical protein